MRAGLPRWNQLQAGSPVGAERGWNNQKVYGGGIGIEGVAWATLTAKVSATKAAIAMINRIRFIGSSTRMTRADYACHRQGITAKPIDYVSLITYEPE